MNQKRFGKALSIFLAICMFVSMFAFSASAENELALKADSTLSIVFENELKLIFGFEEESTVAELLANFEDENAIIVSKDGEALSADEIVGTGTLLTIAEDSAYIVIVGDVDGDGAIDATDYLKIKGALLNVVTLEGVYALAADAQDDGELDITDYLKIKNYFLTASNVEDDTTSDDVTSDDTTSDDVTSDDVPSDDTTGDTTEDTTSEEISEESSEEVSYEYILNIKSKKIHIPTCSGLKTTSEKNKQGYNGDINALLEEGYTICGTCNAGQTESSEDVTSEDVTSEDTTGDTTEDTTSEEISEESSEEVSYEYILNIKSKKIHIPTCSGLKTTSEANKQGYNGDINALLEEGYTICGTCKAGQTESSEDVTSEEVTSEDVTSEDATSEDVTNDTTGDTTSDDVTSEDSSDDTTSDETEGGYTVVTAPEVDTAYKFVLTQANRGEDLYFTGEMNGYYYATTTDADAATDVYLEALGDGYALYFKDGSEKKYLNIVPRENTTKVNIVIESSANSVYKFDSNLNILVTTVSFSDGSSNDFYMGTYNNYNTISASSISYLADESKIGVSQFPAYLATLN